MTDHDSRDPELEAQIDALLADPRGAFRPRVVCIGEDEQLAMLVGIGAGGLLCVVTAEPLPAGATLAVAPGETDPGFVAGSYRVEGARPGNRPEDAQAPCWINLLAGPVVAGDVR